MQQTRQYVLEILKEHSEATIDDIVSELSKRIGKITAVTVRHHLEILRGDGLVAAPTVRRRSAPGRPQYVYMLTEQASDCFPNNYQGLATELLEQIKRQLTHEQVRIILHGVADAMINEANIPDASFEFRQEQALAFLNNHGYEVEWQIDDDERVLLVNNCPYEQISCHNSDLCTMDERLIEGLLDVRMKRLSKKSKDEYNKCSFVILDEI